jgi:nucleotide-binding universal stress UspA family protein
MSAQIIASYDGTPNDDDALVLGRALAAGVSRLALAYVRHSREFDPRREELAQHDAERRLQAGVALLGDQTVETHVIFGASTGDGLEQLAERQGASILVFGSDYRTAPGRAEPGNTAQRLLDGGSLAIAVASAGLRLNPEHPIQTIASAGSADPVVIGTLEAFAARLGAEILAADSPADLILVGSSDVGRFGRVTLSGSSRAALNAARGSVLVLARDVAPAL